MVVHVHCKAHQSSACPSCVMHRRFVESFIPPCALKGGAGRRVRLWTAGVSPGKSRAKELIGEPLKETPSNRPFAAPSRRECTGAEMPRPFAVPTTIPISVALECRPGGRHSQGRSAGGVSASSCARRDRRAGSAGRNRLGETSWTGRRWSSRGARCRCA
jgi:hypothetical protein